MTRTTSSLRCDQSRDGAGRGPGPVILLFSGILMEVLHERHFTVFPRALDGTARIFLHERFGHMIRRVSFGMGWPGNISIGRMNRGLDEVVRPLRKARRDRTREAVLLGPTAKLLRPVSIFFGSHGGRPCSQCDQIDESSRA
jgi:hypothetical protein